MRLWPRIFREETCASTKLVDGEALLPGIVEDGELLVGQVLGTGRHAQVGNCFHATIHQKEKKPFSFTNNNYTIQSVPWSTIA